jgi:hypothetical protein
MPQLFDPTTQLPVSLGGIFLISAIGLCLVLLLARRGAKAYNQIEHTLSKFAERRTLVCYVLFFSVIGARLLVLPGRIRRFSG